jgi:hypothetical protein
MHTFCEVQWIPTWLRHPRHALVYPRMWRLCVGRFFMTKISEDNFFRYFVDCPHLCRMSAQSRPLLASNLPHIRRQSHIHHQHHLLSVLLVKESPRVVSTRLTLKTIFSINFGIQLCNLWGTATLWSSRRPRTILWSFRTAGFAEHWTKKCQKCENQRILRQAWELDLKTTESPRNARGLRDKRPRWDADTDRASKRDGERGVWCVKPLCLMTG